MPELRAYLAQSCVDSAFEGTDFRPLDSRFCTTHETLRLGTLILTHRRQHKGIITEEADILTFLLLSQVP